MRILSLTTALLTFTLISHVLSLSVVDHDKTSSLERRLDSLNTTNIQQRHTSDQKSVLMHVIMGNTMGHTYNDWLNDLSTMAGVGIDAVALNIGKADDWQIDQIAIAYTAAAHVGISTFISFDYSSFPCDVDKTISYINLHKQDYAQFTVDGIPMVSSFLGACLGPQGWQRIKGETGAYLMPFIETDAPSLQSGGPWGFLDQWMCWECAWPQGNFDKNTEEDDWYRYNLGAGRFATTVSAWFYAHYPGNNRYLRGDNHLLVTRWEQVIAMRSNLRFVEYASWNDFGESHYVSPTMSGVQPHGTTWVDGFSHMGWLEMSEYYIQYFKTGHAPQVLTEKVYFWLRPHPRGIDTADWVGKPDGWDWARDSMWAVVFCRTSGHGCSATLAVGGTSMHFGNLQPGPNKLELPLDNSSFGTVRVQVNNHGRNVIDYSPSAEEFQYQSSMENYNFNSFVGSAAAW